MKLLRQLFERVIPPEHPDPTKLNRDELRELFTKRGDLPETTEDNNTFQKQGGE